MDSHFTEILYRSLFILGYIKLQFHHDNNISPHVNIYRLQISLFGKNNMLNFTLGSRYLITLLPREV